MPIKWSAVKVSEAMDEIEGCIEQVVAPLQQARSIAQGARDIPEIPQYVDQYLLRIISEIDRTIGGGQWEVDGRLKEGVNTCRGALPDDALNAERKRIDNGSQMRMTT